MPASPSVGEERGELLAVLADRSRFGGFTARLAETDGDIARHAEAKRQVVTELAAVQGSLGLPDATLADIDNWLGDRLDTLKQALELADKHDAVALFERELEHAIARLISALDSKSGNSGPNRVDVFIRLIRDGARSQCSNTTCRRLARTLIYPRCIAQQDLHIALHQAVAANYLTANASSFLPLFSAATSHRGLLPLPPRSR